MMTSHDLTAVASHIVKFASRYSKMVMNDAIHGGVCYYNAVSICEK